MIKEQGLFSNRYLTRKGKENHNHHNFAIRHHDEIDFPLAFTSAKVISKDRSSISIKKSKQKRNEEKGKEDQDVRNTQIAKLQKELREAKQQCKKVNKELQSKTVQYQNYINELSKELTQKQEAMNKLSLKVKQQVRKHKQETILKQRYAETIKSQIYWLLNMFIRLQQSHYSLENISNEVSNNFLGLKAYIQEFDIEKQLQELASKSSRNHNGSSNIFQVSAISKSQNNVCKKINTDSIFTEDIDELNMIKIMDLHPLIETFNNQNQFIEEEGKIQRQDSNHKMERITKKLFDDSPLFKQYGNSSNISASVISNSQQLGSKQKDQKLNSAEMQLPREVVIVKNFEPDQGQQNFISLVQGQMLKLLRKVRDNLWIGQFKQKIGLVLEASFRMP